MARGDVRPKRGLRLGVMPHTAVIDTVVKQLDNTPGMQST